MSTPAMSARPDFLGRIADRAVGAAAIATPRTPGLFEPVASAALRPAFARDGADDAFDRAFDDRNDAMRARNRRAPHDGAHAPEPSPLRKAPTWMRAPSEQPAMLASARESTETIAPTIRASAARFTREASQPQRAESSGTESSAAFGSVLGADGEALLRAHYRASLAPARVDALVVPTLEPRHAVSRAPIPASPTGQPPLPQNVLAPQRGLRDAGRAQATRSPEPRSTVASAPVQPVIHVSIGRVEVRALQAPRAASPSNAPTQRGPTRLDDFLGRKDRAR